MPKPRMAADQKPRRAPDLRPAQGVRGAVTRQTRSPRFYPLSLKGIEKVSGEWHLIAAPTTWVKLFRFRADHKQRRWWLATG